MMMVELNDTFTLFFVWNHVVQVFRHGEVTAGYPGSAVTARRAIVRSADVKVLVQEGKVWLGA